MAELELPKAIRAFIDTTNAGDAEGFAAVFTEDAYVYDWGREFHGRDGARSWDRSDNIGKQSHFEVLRVEAGAEPDSYDVTAKVTGNGYNGTGVLAFRVRGELVQSLVIR